MAIVSLDEILAAQTRLSGIIRRTPLTPFALPDIAGGAYIKNEGAQITGSFKLRGAYNKIAQLTSKERARGVITYSSGNHAQAVAYAARQLGAKAVVVMPRNAPEVKQRATAALGAEIVPVGPASLERKQKAEELAEEFGYAMVPPYDDPAIIAGQGTCGLEIAEQLPDVDLVIAPVSGGGLLSGVAAALKYQNSDIRVLGVEPELSADAQESLRSGTLVTWPAERTTRTICDGLRTQSLGQLNFEHVCRFVDDIVTVSEDEVREATRALTDAGIKAEPSGAVATAAVMFHGSELPASRKLVAVMSGSNGEPATE